MFRDLALGAPAWMLRVLTWNALALEIASLPLTLWSRTMPLIWCAMVCMHVGIMALVSFADLSAGDADGSPVHTGCTLACGRLAPSVAASPSGPAACQVCLMRITIDDAPGLAHLHA
jgi:hypothetical protein